MKKGLTLILAAALCVGALAACGEKPKAPEVKKIALAGNATTGYTWQADEETIALFGETEPEYVEDKTEGEPVNGIGGTYYFTLGTKLEEPLKAGEYTARFYYARPWGETAGTMKEATVAVTVSEDGSYTYGEPQVNEAVVLPGNATTGYTWQADEETTALFGELTAEYRESEKGEGMVGAGGVFSFSFPAQVSLEAGDYKAQFHYLRPWEGMESAVKTALVPVTVGEDGTLTFGIPEVEEKAEKAETK